MSASKSTELVLSGEKVELTVEVPKTATLPKRVVTVHVAKEIAAQYPAIGQVEEMAELIDEVLGNTGEGLGVADLTRVKVPSGESVAFTVGEDPYKTFTGVIILMQNRMNYWEKPPEEGGGTSAPDCFSRDAKVGQGRYGKGSEHNPTGQCSECPMSQWVEDSDGNRTPSPCKPQVAVLVMMEGKAFPVMFTVPRTSMKALKNYWKRELLMNLKSFAQVETQFGLEKDKNAGGVAFNRVTFTQGTDLGTDVKKVMLSLGERYRDILANVDTSADTEATATSGERPNSAADAAAGFSIIDDEPPMDDVPEWDAADAEEDYVGASR